MDIFSIIEDTVKPLGVGIDASIVKEMTPGKILGRKVESAADLASLMQEYRNPQYETSRIFYIKENRIVSVESYSSHLPNLSRIGASTLAELRQNILTHKEAVGADKYYLLHNHPSGDPKPSMNDIWLTASIASPEEGFAGHIVIDHTTFALIDHIGNYKFLDVPNHFENDIFHTPTLSHPLLNKVLYGPEDVAEVGRKLIDYRDDISIAIFTSASGKIVAMTEFSNKLAEDETLLKAYTEKAAIDYGATNTFILTTSDRAYEYRKDLVEQAYTRDVLLMDEMGFYWSANEENIEKDKDIVFAGKTMAEFPLYVQSFCEDERDDAAHQEIER